MQIEKKFWQMENLFGLCWRSVVSTNELAGMYTTNIYPEVSMHTNSASITLMQTLGQARQETEAGGSLRPDNP